MLTTEKFLRPLSIWETIKEVLTCYCHIFWRILGLVVIAAALQALVSILMPENPTVGLAVSVLNAVIAMFFYAWILAHADNLLMNRPATLHDSLKVAKDRYLALLALLLLYVVIMMVLGVFAFGMQLLGSTFHIVYLFALITLCFLIFIFTLIAFAMPAVILDQKPALKSFEYSARLVWGHWWRTFFIFMIFVIPVVILSLAILIFQTRNILVITVYEFFYHIITYPLMIAVVLVLYHDLKTRKQISNVKHLDERTHTE